jgi:thiamine biosynthesis protein ThiS
MADQISIIVNGFTESVVRGATIAFLIEHFNEIDPDLIVELNGVFVYPLDYGSTVVEENDTVELIHPHFGG